MEQPAVVSVDRWSLYGGRVVSLRWSMEQPAVVSVDRWSLYGGRVVSLRWSMEQPAVVSVDRWSLRQLSMYCSLCTVYEAEKEAVEGRAAAAEGKSERTHVERNLTCVEDNQCIEPH